MKRSLLLFGLVVACATPPPPPPAPPAPAPVAVAEAPKPKGPVPPVARKEPRATVLHGDTRVDDYAWLRDKESPEVRGYLEAENAYTDAVLAPLEPLRKRLYDEMLGRIQQTDLSVPWPRDGYLYYSRTEEGKQYPIWCRKKGGLDAPEQVLVDLNVLGEGKPFISLGAWRVSDDGNLLAYALDVTGFRQYTLYVKDLRTGQLLPERFEKAAFVDWAADNRTLFYTVEDAAKRSYRLYRHVLGTDAASDTLVHEEKDERFRLSVFRSRSREWLFISSGSHTTSEVRVLSARKPTEAPRVVAPRQQDHEYELEHRGDLFYIRTNRGGRNFSLVTAPVKAPGPENWKELVPHRDNVMLEGVDAFADFLVSYEREDGLPRLTVTDLKTRKTHRVEFPEAVYDVYPVQNAEWKTRALRFSYQSPVTPPSTFDYDMGTRERTLLKEQPVLGGYDRTRYQTERVHAVAADGTKVPVSLVYRKGLARDGKAPLLLRGYGSYGFPLGAFFSSNDVSLLDRGVVLAQAHVRGGGDLGKAWHDAGRMLNKRNTFTDFIAVAEHLVAQGYTSPSRLAITGGSAGGLLMGAVSNLRPDLFRVVLSYVPFVDVLNTMLDASLPLTVGEFEEWGNPQDKRYYEYMRTYCPYTNLAAKAYPAMLVRTSLNDSQVMYWEPAKYVAKLRTLKANDTPLLLKVNMAAGHGGASGRYDRLKDTALDYAFLLTQLGVEAVETARP